MLLIIELKSPTSKNMVKIYSEKPVVQKVVELIDKYVIGYKTVV